MRSCQNQQLLSLVSFSFVFRFLSIEILWYALWCLKIFGTVFCTVKSSLADLLYLNIRIFGTIFGTVSLLFCKN